MGLSAAKCEGIIYDGTFTLSTAKSADTKHILFKTEFGDKKMEEV